MSPILNLSTAHIRYTRSNFGKCCEFCSLYFLNVDTELQLINTEINFTSLLKMTLVSNRLNCFNKIGRID